MVLFPDGFPFVRKPEAPSQEAVEPVPAVEEALPAPAPEPRPVPWWRRSAANPPVTAPPAPEEAPAASEPTPAPLPAIAPAPLIHVPEPVAVLPPALPVAVPPRLVQPPVTKLPFPDRRKAKRDVLAAPAVLRMDDGTVLRNRALKIELMNMSILGIRFRTHEQIDIGDTGQIRMEVGPLRWTTRLRVVTCLPDPLGTPGSYAIGCAFLRTELLRPWPAAAA
jgi:hypothetical protein